MRGKTYFHFYPLHGSRMVCVVEEDGTIIGKVGRTWEPVGRIVETPSGPVVFIGQGLSRYEW